MVVDEWEIVIIEDFLWLPKEIQSRIEMINTLKVPNKVFYKDMVMYENV